MSFFASNPFSSPVGQRIEKATNESLASEDWTLCIEICDIINESEDAHKEAIKAIKKKLVANKKWKEVMYTLTLLETCVKNCGHRFHVLICKQDFIKEMVKIIQPSSNPPTIVQEKILMLIQSWADAFRAQPDLHGVVKVYEELRNKGIEFPATNLDTLAPIITPERSVPEVDPAVSRPPPHRPVAMQAQQPHHHHQPPVAPTQPAGPVNLSPEQLAKMQKDLEMVQGNYRVFSEMLTEMTPGQENSGDLELLQELNRTCRAMQSRVVHLLDKVSNEEVTGELLRINDDLNNVFVRYDRFERYRQQAQGTQSQQPASAQPSAMVGGGVVVNPPAYQVGVSSPAYLVGAQPTVGSSYPAASPGYPAPSPGYPAPSPGYPAPSPGYPAPSPGYPAPSPGYPAASPGYPASGPGYPTGAPTNTTPAYGNNLAPSTQPPPQNNVDSSVGTLISFDDDPAAAVQQPSPAVGQLSQQLAGLGMDGDSVSNTLGQLQSVPPPANQANADDFDMFALSRQTAYQDPSRGGSTYSDNSNMDQTMGGLANAMNSRAVNPFASESQAMCQPEGNTESQDVIDEATDFSQLENMEQWLQDSDLSKAVDSTAAANTNTEGITSSEFDKFLEERAAAGDTLPTQPASGNRGGRQLKMEETENTMFSL